MSLNRRIRLKGKPTDKAHTWTYAELLSITTRAANLFHSLGATDKNSVALILPNLPETLAAMFAAQTSGIVNPINPLLEPSQIASILRDADAKVVVTLAGFPKTEIAQNVAEALKTTPTVETVIEVDMRRYVSPPLSWLIPLIRPKIDRVAAYFHTGGTTGDPKLATHKIGGMIFIGHTVKEGVLTEGDVILCALPLFHCFGAYVMGLTSPMNGGHLILMTPAGFRGEGVIDNFWKLVERYKVNFFMSVPTALAALNQRPIDADVSTFAQARPPRTKSAKFVSLAHMSSPAIKTFRATRFLSQDRTATNGCALAIWGVSIPTGIFGLQAGRKT